MLINIYIRKIIYLIFLWLNKSNKAQCDIINNLINSKSIIHTTNAYVKLLNDNTVKLKIASLKQKPP